MTILLLPLLAAGVVSVDAPISAVTVYSDRARVVRTGVAPPAPSGTGRRIALPLLPDSADPATIRLEARASELQRVDVARVDEDDFPADEAARLLAKLEALDDRIARARGETQAATTLVEALRRLAPIPPASEPLKPPRRLDAGGWPAALEFARSWQERLQAKAREGEERLADLARDRATLAEQARLVGGARRRSGYRVTATLVGGGGGELSLSNEVAGARWYPTYDVQLLPERGRVQVAFGGLVSQESGEDWVQAPLTLSTAVPSTATRFPTLLTWKIGERERFIPTPSPVAEPLRPAPHAAPPTTSDDGEREALRSALLARAGAVANEDAESTNGMLLEGAGEALGARGTLGGAVGGPRMMRAPTPAAPMPAMAPPRSSPRESAAGVLDASVEVALANERARSTSPAPVVVGLALAPPPGWTPPVFAADLPASAAGGWDLHYRSLRDETIRSGQGARRVALFSESWPVSVERKLFPALAPEAYLVAEIANPLPRPLPAGQANLFVGADPAGVARLGLVGAGETFTLPLGIDRAVRPGRNVKVVTEEKGLLSKDELSTYAVTIEVANPYAMPLAVRLLDQIPVTSDPHVEVKLVRTEPAATVDKVVGALEWRMTVPASGKAQASFVYTLRRPKGWRLHQSN